MPSSIYVRYTLLLFFMGFVCGSWSCLRAQESSQRQAELVKQSVNPTTLLIARIDTKHLNLPQEVQNVLATDTEVQPLLSWIASLNTALGPLTNEPLLMLVDLPFSSAQAPVRFVARQPARLNLDELNAGLRTFRFGPVVAIGETLSTASGGNLLESNRVLVASELLPANQAAIESALGSVQNMPVQVVVVPPAYLWSTYVDLMPRLPQEWGGTPITIITEGLQWASLGFDPSTLKLRITIQSKNSSAAERLKAELPKLIEIALDKSPLSKLKQALKNLKVEQPTIHQDRIELAVSLSNFQDVKATTGAFAKVVTALVDPLHTRDKMKRFRELALAIHNYESANKVLPPNQAMRQPDGKSRLSWRVHILPYLGQVELYKEFKLEEAWDSEHNRKLLDKMPDIYSSYPLPTMPNRLNPGYTTILAPAGEGSMLSSHKPVTFSQVGDGLSNTVFFVEVKTEAAIPWTAPLDYEFQPANPADGLAIGPDGQFLAAFGDGSVRLLPGNLPKETLLRLFNMNDGQPIKLP